MAVLKFKDGLGVWHSIPAIQGASAYEQAVDGGYIGTLEDFYLALNEVNAAVQAAEDAEDSASAAAASAAQLAAGVASPAGTYANLDALNTVNPDHSKVYVVTADGHWYYWNGSAWADGGVYQATAVDDYSIKPMKTSFFMTGKNLFDINDPNVRLGGYYYTNNAWTASAGINASGFIRVLPETDYTASWKTLPVVWYDINRTYLSATSSTTFNADGHVTSPVGACYARFHASTESWAAFQVEAGTTPTAYEAYREYVKPENAYDFTLVDSGGYFDSATANAALQEVGAELSDLSVLNIAPNKNLFNPDDPDILMTHYYDRDHVYSYNASIFYSGYIPVTAGEDYTCNIKNTIAWWYDAEKQPISYEYDYGTPGYITAPVGAVYIRHSGSISTIGSFQFEAGQINTTYEAYRLVVANSALPVIRPQNLIGKLWTSLGDSITSRGLWQPHVVAWFGLVHTNCGIGSTCLAGPADEALPCFWEDSRINAVKAADPDILTILGGSNDQGHSPYVTIGTDAEFEAALGSKDKGTFKGAYSYIIETLLTWKPTLIIIPMSTPFGHSEALYNGLTYRDFAQATKEVAWYYGLPCADLRGESLLNKITKATYTADNIHPNAAGAKRIADLVIRTLNGFIVT